MLYMYMLYMYVIYVYITQVKGESSDQTSTEGIICTESESLSQIYKWTNLLEERGTVCSVRPQTVLY